MVNNFQNVSFVKSSVSVVKVLIIFAGFMIGYTQVYRNTKKVGGAYDWIENIDCLERQEIKKCYNI